MKAPAKAEACKGCEYNTPKTRGGKGRICNGVTMRDLRRCPEWVINERRALRTK